MYGLLFTGDHPNKVLVESAQRIGGARNLKARAIQSPLFYATRAGGLRISCSPHILSTRRRLPANLTYCSSAVLVFALLEMCTVHITLHPNPHRSS